MTLSTLRDYALQRLSEFSIFSDTDYVEAWFTVPNQYQDIRIVCCISLTGIFYRFSAGIALEVITGDSVQAESIFSFLTS